MKRWYQLVCLRWQGHSSATRQTETETHATGRLRENCSMCLHLHCHVWLWLSMMDERERTSKKISHFQIDMTTGSLPVTITTRKYIKLRWSLNEVNWPCQHKNILLRRFVAVFLRLHLEANANLFLSFYLRAWLIYCRKLTKWISCTYKCQYNYVVNCQLLLL